VVRRWITRRWLCEPPWTLEQLRQIRDITDPDGRRSGPQAAHGTQIRWMEGCDCDPCGLARKAQERLPVKVRQPLLDGIYAGRPFRDVPSSGSAVDWTRQRYAAPARVRIDRTQDEGWRLNYRPQHLRRPRSLAPLTPAGRPAPPLRTPFNRSPSHDQLHFSEVGDGPRSTQADGFAGTLSTALAASYWARHR
jgi:hypothetical protein